ncbi:amino acid permease [uncultured Thiodictyon sp.]|jgi:APA family basic amino acid/polyamine antiporter|uniref:amino acid permease n=1 Tax=uncultured Thiodictyon sp. TaxID=1846217 RepID=UPI0025F22AEC|nr:amino acid permease [uncultured Thiodictyon sp.]
MTGLLRTKTINADHHLVDTGLRRVLGPVDLTLLGVGAIIGAGIFVLTGVAAATYAGPAIVLSYVVAGFACAFAALAYAELAAAIGGCGSAYGYSYAGLGELVAWIIGWDLILEYSVAVSAVAIGWSAYMNNALQAMGLALPAELLKGPLEGGLINLPAAAIVLILGLLLTLGVRQSARFNAAMVLIKLLAIGVFIAIAVSHVNPANWSPFMPFGWSGVMGGAALIFFAYVGFDAVSTAAEEARNPQRDLPIGILVSLAVCTLIYILVAGLLTGVVPYATLNVGSPVADVVLRLGYPWGAGLVAAGAIAGLTTVMLVLYYGLTRVFLAIARDGLLPPLFARVNPRTQTPVRVIAASGLLMAAIAGLTPIGDVAELVNIGTLAAFFLVSVGVLVLRYTHPDLPRPFRTPFSPLIPLLGAASCLYLMASLPLVTWLRFGVWLALGLLIYFTYSRHHSALAVPA